MIPFLAAMGINLAKRRVTLNVAPSALFGLLNGMIHGLTAAAIQ
jgi:hypothetical protein